MKQSVFRLLSVILAAGLGSAQSLIPINTDAIKKAVVFLYGADSTGNPDTSKEVATGFLIGVPSASNPSSSYLILVTARHVFDPKWACTATSNPNVLYARVNKRSSDTSGTVDFQKLVLVENNQQLWSKHQSDAVDAAVLVIKEPAPLFENDVTFIRLGDFGSPDEIKVVGIGDDIVSAGLVPGFSGKKRNNPFFKFGKVSNIPDEDGEIPCGTTAKPGKYWFVAATLIPGNSGSPIFYLPPGNAAINFGGRRPFLLGLQSLSLINGEIAGMVPVQYIFEIIESLGLKDVNLTRGPSNPTSEAPKP